MTGHINIVIAEPSDVIRRGIRSVLSTDDTVSTVITEVGLGEILREVMVKNRPDVLIVNPVIGAHLPPAAIRREFPDTRCVMLSGTHADATAASLFDDVVSVCDPAHTIRERILRPFQSARKSARDHESLSKREKDVVVCVVKGMTNRQIADELHLSHHTVGTHRRNISSKLGIHSTSGLTVYAISSKLISLEEINGA